MKLIILNNFDNVSPMNHFCEVCSQMAMWFQEEMSFKDTVETDDGHTAITFSHCDSYFHTKADTG